MTALLRWIVAVARLAWGLTIVLACWAAAIWIIAKLLGL